IIALNLGGSGIHTITPTTALPTITSPVVLDASQPEFPGLPMLELNGNNLGANGLTITAGGTTVRGLNIHSFNGPGISIATNGGNIIQGNFIGTDPTGSFALPNNSSGIIVSSLDNLIGGLTAAARNVISGNLNSGVLLLNSGANNNIVEGNYIGTNALG